MFWKKKNKQPTEKKNLLVEYYFHKFLNNDCCLLYSRPFMFDTSSKELSYDDALELSKVIIKKINEDNLKRVIHMDYTGFRDGYDNVDYLLSKFNVSEMDELDYLVFGQKITSIQEIKDFLFNVGYEFDFLEDIHLNHDKLQELDNFNIDFSVLNPKNRCFVKRFLEDYEETENGIKRNLCPGVGYEHYEFICNKEDAYDNLSLIYEFKRLFVEFLLSESNEENIKDIIYSIESIEEYPAVLENDHLLAMTIAHNKHLAPKLTAESKIGVFYTIDIVIQALKLNPSCYYYIDEYYKKNDMIASLTLDLDIRLLPEIIKVNNLNEVDIKKKIKEFLV